jgi:hypothetical protein
VLHWLLWLLWLFLMMSWSVWMLLPHNLERNLDERWSSLEFRPWDQISFPFVTIHTLPGLTKLTIISIQREIFKIGFHFIWIPSGGLRWIFRNQIWTDQRDIMQSRTEHSQHCCQRSILHFYLDTCVSTLCYLTTQYNVPPTKGWWHILTQSRERIH